jgi:hypothetical protein
MHGRWLRIATTTLRLLTVLWPPELRRSSAAEYESLLLGVLRDAHDRGGWPAVLGRWLYEVWDTVATAFQARPRPVRWALASACTAAVAALVVVPLLPSHGSPGELVVHAHDPAGEFTLTFRRGAVVAATVDRIAYPSAHLVQTPDSVRVLDATGRTLVAVEFQAPGTIRWDARNGVGE